MNDNHTGASERLEQARALVASLEQGDDQEAERLLDKLTDPEEGDLFQEIGKLTRRLHESINSFATDERITSLAEKDIPDAKERLQYVIERTEHAANVALDMVEKSVPLAEEMGKRAEELSARWQRFRAREMDADEFRTLSHDLEGFFDMVSGNNRELQGNLNEVLMAQDFQDITGQIIKRVIGLVQEVEESLVRLVRVTGQRLAGTETEKKKEEEKPGELEGPQVPGLAADDAVTSQDDVDDLLSSLGF